MLCIFNPEHDHCLANGNRHFVPPASALRFAREGATLMRVVYPEAETADVAQCGRVYAELTANGDSPALVPWGWNLVLKTQLLKAGIPEALMPADNRLALWRQLQHRATLLPLQPESRAVTLRAEVEAMLSQHGAVVLKAPWSGSGRGLRWIGRQMTAHDILWMNKVVKEQQCVVAEPWRKVADDFALEYRVQRGCLFFEGYSLFRSAKGVYRANILLDDGEIADRVGVSAVLRRELEDWLNSHVVPHYEGPLGVDCLRDTEGRLFVSELNLRHTMGLVAHAYLRHHPEAEGRQLELKGGDMVVSATSD